MVEGDGRLQCLSARGIVAVESQGAWPWSGTYAITSDTGLGRSLWSIWIPLAIPLVGVGTASLWCRLSKVNNAS